MVLVLHTFDPYRAHSLAASLCLWPAKFNLASVLVGRSSREDTQAAELEIARKYVASLPQKIAEWVKLADAGLKPGRISAGHGREESIAFNRRCFMRDGTVGWNPGKLNPNILPG